MTPRLRAAIVAVVAALLCGWIGTNVSEAPPAGIDLAGRALAGHLVPLAIVFTASCWWQVLVSFGIAGLVVARFAPGWRARIVFSILVTIVGWLASDSLKHVFGRTRPDYWIFIRETSAAYPSGHAMFAVIVYGLWAYYVARSSLPRTTRIVLSTILTLWMCGIWWSRLALGAHFVTDIIGGMLFGILMLSIATAIAGVIPSVVEGQPRSLRS